MQPLGPQDLHLQMGITTCVSQGFCEGHSWHLAYTSLSKCWPTEGVWAGGRLAHGWLSSLKGRVTGE